MFNGFNGGGGGKLEDDRCYDRISVAVKLYMRLWRREKILPGMMWTIITMWEVTASFMNVYNIFTHTVCVTISNREIDLVSHIDRLIISFLKYF